MAATVLCLGIATVFCMSLGWIAVEASRSQRALEREREGNRLIDSSWEARSLEDLSQAQVRLSAFRETIKSEPRLAGLMARINASVGRVDRRFKELRAREASIERDRVVRGRFETFLKLRDQAQFSASGFELEPIGRLARLRDSARAALAVYAQDPKSADEDWTLVSSLPDTLSEGEKTRIAEGCYDLLLLLSQSVDPTRGLKILDRAERSAAGAHCGVFPAPRRLPGQGR